MRICVLLSAYPAGSSPVAGHDPAYEPGHWLDGHEVETIEVHRATARAQVQALVGRGHDVILNLCEGTWFEEVAGIEVVEELERLGLPFAGTSARLYGLRKEAMKQAAVDLGVTTPAYAFVRTEADLARALATLRFPMIVKHFDGCASIGMTRASRVETATALRSQVAATWAVAEAALVEEFVDGDEYTVLVAENPDAPAAPLVMTPVRCGFPPGETFKHFDLKWHGYAGLAWQPCADPALAAALVDATRRMFVGVDGVAWARCDFRVDAAGRAWLLEINTTCGIFYPPGQEGSADVILAADPAGHRGFLELIFASAARRQRVRPRRRAAMVADAGMS